MLRVELEQTAGTNVFWLGGDGPGHGRIFGAVRDRSKNRWVYPAYAPIGPIVLQDLRQVYPNAELSSEAQAWATYLGEVPKALAARDLPVPALPVKPFDHQLEGLAYLYHNERWALLWEPGVGKTKVLCDLKLQLPGQRMLVMAPRVVVPTWLKEIAVHSAGTLKAAAIEGTPTKKKSVIKNYADYDVLVCTYGTARTMGHPNLSRAALTVLNSSGRSDVRAAGKIIARAGDPKVQKRLAQDWVDGASLSEVESRIGPQEPSWLCDIDYQIIVADESHNIKQLTSQQTKAALALSVKARRRYIMSGTPALGDPRHLYPQLRFLSPALMSEDWFSFNEKFLVHAPHNRHIVTGFKNLHIINQRVDRIASRKRKDECLDLPERQVIDIPVKPSATQIKLYNEFIATMQADLATYIQTGGVEGVVQAQNAAVRLNKLAQVLSGFVYTTADVVQDTAVTVQWLPENPKLDALKELLETVLLDETHKVIVWCVYAPEIASIEQTLKKSDVGYIKLDGTTSQKAGPLLKKFDTDPKCRVMVGQIGAGIGFTANAAAYTIYYSLDWSLDKYLQSIDRNYRAGQTKKVTVYRLLCENTVDGLKAQALDRKKDISALMTQKLACVTCANSVKCAENDIKLFDKKCLYRRSVGRVVAKPGSLEENIDEGDFGDGGSAGDPEPTPGQGPGAGAGNGTSGADPGDRN